MSIIQKRFQESVVQVVREHFLGNTIKKRWELRPKKQAVLQKLRLVLAWVMGPTVLKLKPRQVMYHIIEHYKNYDHDGYLTKKYGEYYV